MSHTPLPQPLQPADLPIPKGHYSPAMVYGSLVFVSGQLPIDAQGNKHLSSVAAETQQCLDNLEAILLAAGSSRNQVLKCTVFISDIQYWAEVNGVYAAFFGEHRPARAIVPCGLLNHGCHVEIDCIAALTPSQP